MGKASRAALLAALAVMAPLCANADDTPPAPAAPAASADTVHTLPADTAPVTTGSLDPATPPPPLAGIGRAVREALPLVPDPDGEPQAPDAPKPAARSKPPAPEEAALSDNNADRAGIAAFYTARNDAPLWVTIKGLTPHAAQAMAEIRRAGFWGMKVQDFELPAIAEANSGGADLADAELTSAEMALSLAVLKYARYAGGGAIAKPARQLSSYYDRKPQVKDRKTILDEIAAASDPAAYLVSLQPQHPQFEKLRQAWLEARRAQDGKPGKLTADLKAGDNHAEVAVLRKRMGLVAAAGGSEQLYDDALVKAVAGFQAYRGLSPADGTVNAATREALARPIKGKPDQLLANMQAWRYLPGDLGSIYVWVNVPEYLIRIVKNGEIVWTERITAGLVNKQTPIFSDQMERVTFKSRWRVPDSIKVREVWPSLLRGGGLMRQHGLMMMNKDGQEVDWKAINWSAANMEDYTLWQPPGPKNQLGVVKFSFPSKHYVFMHDTPDKYMFKWARRANSHGCMRIRNPLDMATIILGHDQGWDRAKVDDAVNNGPDHNIVELKAKVPVHITYFTARVSDGGKIETWGDIYGHERRIVQALAGQWNKIAVPHDHLAPLDQTKVPVASSAVRKPKPLDNSTQSIFSAAFGGL